MIRESFKSCCLNKRHHLLSWYGELAGVAINYTVVSDDKRSTKVNSLRLVVLLITQQKPPALRKECVQRLYRSNCVLNPEVTLIYAKLINRGRSGMMRVSIGL
jgi:hypothetical protein